MTFRLFLYSSDATADTRGMFRKKGYETVGLTGDPAFFWSQIERIDNGGSLVIMSHGDRHGFLMIDGHGGDDMTDAEIERFGHFLRDKRVTLYLLSCHTGCDPFCQKLLGTGCHFVAPKGFALAESTSQSLSVYSVEHLDAPRRVYPGWGGNAALCPRRGSSALNIR